MHPSCRRPGRTVPTFRLSGVALALSAAGLHSMAAAAEPVPAERVMTVEVIGTTPIDDTGVTLAQFPANAQRLSGRDAEAQGSTNLADLLDANVGPVSVSGGTGNPYQNDINYRGFQASSLLGAPVGLSVYFDGIRMNEPFGSVVNWDLIPMNAVSGVTLLPGSNPVFGMNTLGGALVVDTKNGRDDSGTTVELVGGSFGRFGVNANVGWADDGSGTDVFLSVNDDKQDGYRTHSASRVKQAYAKARWHDVAHRTEIALSGAFADTSLNGTQALPEDMLSDRRAAYTWPDSTANRHALLSLKGSHWLDDANQLTGNVYGRHARTASLNSNAGLDDGCFNDDGSIATSTTGGVTTAKCGNKAPGGTAVNSVTGANALALGYGRWTSAINTSLVDSLTRTSTGGGALQWANSGDLAGRKNSFTLGGSLDRSHIRYGQDTTLAKLVGYQTVVIPNQEYGFTPNGLAPSAANLPAFSGSNVLSGVDLTSATTNFSAYFTDTLTPMRQLAVTLSGSWSDTRLRQAGSNNQYLNDDGGYSWTDDVSGASFYNPSYATAYKYSNTGSGALAAANGIPAGAIAGPETNSLDGSHRYHRFSPAVGVDYSFDNGQDLFAGYSESMRAPTAIELSCADPDHPCALPTGFNGDPDLKAVVARTLEIGGRGKLGKTLRWNAAVYDSRLANDIQFIATSASFGYFANVGATRRRGAEAGVQATFDKLFLSANAAYVDATYRTPFTTAAGQDVTAGNRIPGIAASTFKLRAAWGTGAGVSVGANLIVAGKQTAHGNESNTDPAGVVAGYSLVNLDVHYQVTDAVAVSVFINNLFDRRYSTYGLSGTPSIYTLVSQQFQTPAPPRAVWASLRWSFGGRSAKHTG